MACTAAGTCATAGDGSARDDGAERVAAALAELVVALEANIGRAAMAIERAADNARLLANGESLAEVLAEPGTSVIEAINENLRSLTLAGARLRRAQAQELHRGGMTMEEIARLFGVSRQRVSALLRSPEQIDGPPWTRHGSA
ncbi:MAG: hypothetical protein JO050_10460 [Acidimicrobiia bacterium]|nr:hypothetical protein [Acidimicrobiia bacterium]